MASRPAQPVIIEVKFEGRDDGGLRAYCDNVPGFVLSHADPEAVLADVEPALETILSAMYGMDVCVRKAETVGAEGNITSMPAHLCGAAQYVGLRHNA